MSSSDSRSVSLVLGSGGARGLAHVGVIRWLESNDFRIDSISGASMGALVGGIYACGKIDEYIDWLRALSDLDVVRLLDISVGEGGFVRGDRIIEALRGLVGEYRIEDLPLRYTAVASDIDAEKEVWLDSGPLFDAIRASISLPLFFTPADVDGRRLLDGGILNPVPIAPTFRDNTDLTIAVNLGGPKQAETSLARPVEHPEVSGSFKETVTNFIGELSDKAVKVGSTRADMLNIANQTFDTMQSALARQSLATYPPDAQVTIARNACGTLEFDRVDEMVELGLECAERDLSHLLAG